MDKKTWVIISLSIIICILVFIITIGDSRTAVDFEQIRGERDSAIRSAEIIETELSEAIIRIGELEAGNKRIKKIVDDLTAGSKVTDKGLGEYGDINRQLTDFIQRFGTEE